MVVVERGDLVMVFNFHPVQSYTDYRVGCNNPGAARRGRHAAALLRSALLHATPTMLRAACCVRLRLARSPHSTLPGAAACTPAMPRAAP